MIDPRAIAAFLDHPRDSHAWVKRLSEADLDSALADLAFAPADPTRPLRKHQKAVCLLGLCYPQFFLQLDMGLGKSRIVLEVLNHFYRDLKLRSTLILVPTEHAVFSWENEIARWKILLPFLALPNAPTAEKWDALNEFDRGLIIATYPGLTWMVSGKVQKGKRVKLAKDRKLVDRLAKRLDAIVLDESTKIGNHASLAYKICRALSEHCRIRYALAGRPFARDPMMLWSQQFLIDRGASLGETLGLYRAALFTEKRGYFGGYEYTFDKRMEPDLARMMQHRSISYASSECQALPPVTRIVEEVRLPQDIAAYYEKAREQLKAAKGNPLQIQQTFLRMRQLSSGFIGYRDDESGERAEIVFPENPKLDALMDLVSAIPQDCKFVIFYEYTHSGRTISKALVDAKIKHGWLWSGTKDGRAIQERFNADSDYRGLVVQSKVGAMALNLQAANYCLFYESPVSVIDREQSGRRCFREGQTKPGFMYDLVARGTVDSRILAFHKSGEELMRALLRNPALALEGGKL